MGSLWYAFFICENYLMAMFCGIVFWPNYATLTWWSYGSWYIVLKVRFCETRQILQLLGHQVVPFLCTHTSVCTHTGFIWNFGWQLNNRIGKRFYFITLLFCRVGLFIFIFSLQMQTIHRPALNSERIFENNYMKMF